MSPSRTRWVWRGVVALVVAVALVYPIPGVFWSGGFPSAEYRLHFVDDQGRPVVGVRLDVFTQAGGRCYHYPINEYQPAATVQSDTDGRLVIHHVGTLEYGGQDRRNFLGMQFGEGGSPKYDCVFSHEGREVHRIRYNKLYPWERDHIPTVERDWSFTAWTREEWDGWEFDCNRDGTLDREERVARHYIWGCFEMTESRTKSFDIVEKTITVSRPR